MGIPINIEVRQLQFYRDCFYSPSRNIRRFYVVKESLFNVELFLGTCYIPTRTMKDVKAQMAMATAKYGYENAGT